VFEKIKSIEKSNDTIGNRTYDLSVCGVEPVTDQNFHEEGKSM
jgi:hypothetical protein